MDFKANEDIEVPIDTVFAQVSDFALYERQALRRGAAVRRQGAAVGPGLAWDIDFEFRAKARKLRAEIETWDPPNGYSVRARSGGLEALTEIELVALSRDRTRLNVRMQVDPRTLTARLLLQSMKLARATLTRRFAARVAKFAEEIEATHGRPGAAPRR